MLVLTRRVSTRIIIDGNIVVTVLSIDGKQVKIGIEAPKEVTVLRAEVAPIAAPEQRNESTTN